MRRWGLPKLVLLLLVLSLALTVAMADDAIDSEDDIWEDIEDDDSPVLSSTKRVSQSALVQVNDRNADSILKSNEYVMLLGYASWCKQSAAAMVDYAQAALILQAKKNPVVLARVDAIVNTVTAGRYNIKGYPTILFFRNGSSVIYMGGRSSEEIVNWIQKHTGHPTTTISTEEEAKEILRRKQTAVVVGYFEEFQGSEYEDFVAASMEVSDVEFVQTSSARAAVSFKPEMAKRVPSVGLFDSEDGFELMEGSLAKDEIVAFSNMYKYPMVTTLHSQNVGKVYNSPLKKHVILFAGEDDFEDLFETYRSVALAFKNKLMFLWVDTADEDFAKPMMTMYGITVNEPVVAGFDNNNGFRYMLDEEEVTKEALMVWAEKFLEGKLELHQKSERIPKDNSGDVKVVVGKTFRSMVLERSTDLVLLITTPYCPDCEAMGKVFTKVAKYFKGNSSLVFGKFDSSANEHPDLKVFNMPAVLFYSVDGLGQEPVLGPAKPYFKKLVRFVEEHWHRQPSTTSNLSKEPETGEKITEIRDGQGSISPSLITDADSGSSETVPEVPLSTGSKFEEPVTASADAVISEVVHSEVESAETVTEVKPAEENKVDLMEETGTPLLLTIPEEVKKVDSSETEQKAVQGDVEVDDLSKDVSADVGVADEVLSVETDVLSLLTVPDEVNIGDSSRTVQKAVPVDVEVNDLSKEFSAGVGVVADSSRTKDSSAEVDRNVECLSEHVSPKAPGRDSSKAELRVAHENRDTEDLIAGETSYKDEL
ncbi:hypothetical protein R1flu_011531 [Riccia fluitans]|uniref:Thioredoxin domain-containing protein n=1 Tax=Riccia fluitans TaxID=41844 RepID=A0ABD1Z988_9MARC